MRLWDVVVVGAGPSGALAAREVARRGAAVLLLDRAPFPRWKVCGACLSSGARRVLEDVGLGSLPVECGGVDLRRLVLHAGARPASVPLAGSKVLSRSTLDAALVGAAEAAGAVFWPGARASLRAADEDARLVRVLRDERSADVSARVVVDATGLGHGLRAERAATGFAPEVAEHSRVGLGAVFRDGGYPVAEGDLHMVVGRSGYVGLVRHEDGTLNVGAAIDPERLRAVPPEEAVSELLVQAGLPPLRARPLAGWRGTPPLTRTCPDGGARRLFRVGDAAGYVEPFTGEGICWALSAGRAVAGLAAAAAERWSDELLTGWDTYRARTLGRSQRLCRVVARGLRRPWLVGAAVAALRVAPGLASPFVARAGRAPAEVGV